MLRNSNSGDVFLLGVFLSIFALIGFFDAALHIGGLFTGESFPINPLTLLIELATGKTAPSQEAWIGAGVFLGTLVVLTIVLLALFRKAKGAGRIKHRRGDAQAKAASTRAQSAAVRHGAVSKKARSLLGEAYADVAEEKPGFFLGLAVNDGGRL